MDEVTQVRILFSQLSKIFSIVECFGYEFKRLTGYGFSSHYIKKGIQFYKRRLADLLQPIKCGNRREKIDTGNYRHNLNQLLLKSLTSLIK
jgi:hypothetical protein